MGAMDGWANKHNNITLSNASMYETVRKRKSLTSGRYPQHPSYYNITYRFKWTCNFFLYVNTCTINLWEYL